MLQAYRFEGDDDGCTGRASRVLPTLWESDSMVMAESDGADGDLPELRQLANIVAREPPKFENRSAGHIKHARTCRALV